jgi:hypothetical protein
LTPLVRRILFGAVVLAIGVGGLWAYFHYIHYAGPTIAWKRNGQEYELLSPRNLIIAFIGAPFFVWMIGRSLADLPWPQRIMSVLLRIVFVSLLAFGLARLARTATTQKVATVFIVDVSESVPDLAIEDARVEIQKAIDNKPPDALIRIITFSARPRVVPMGDDDKKVPALERHDAIERRELAAKGVPVKADAKKLGQDAATDIASALQLAYGLYPAGYLRRAVILTDGVQTDGDLLAEANRAREFGVKLYTEAYKRPVPGEVALRELRVPDKVRVGEPFELHANIFSSRAQKAHARPSTGSTASARWTSRPATTTSPSRASCASPARSPTPSTSRTSRKTASRRTTTTPSLRRSRGVRRCSTSRGTRRARATSRARSPRRSSTSTSGVPASSLRAFASSSATTSSSSAMPRPTR